MGHFSYIGDAQIGAESNISAGTITCNSGVKIKATSPAAPKRQKVCARRSVASNWVASSATALR